MKHIMIYVHGKGGSAAEAEHYKALFPEAEVLGFDYRAQTPWEATAKAMRQAYARGKQHRCVFLHVFAG